MLKKLKGRRKPKTPEPPLPPIILRRWLRCKRCTISKWRRHAVIGEGPLPADICMIGEGPGKVEDLWGLPFQGKAGRILRQGIVDATYMAGLQRPPTIYITNLVACRPTNAKDAKNRAPTPEEAWACWRRLATILEMCKAQRVFLLGRVPQKLCKETCPGALKLIHPSGLGYIGGTECPEYRTFCRRMADAFREVSGLSSKSVRLFPRR